ncbi:hypothetical protein A2Z22_00470 [Candidatus Woesebacteria bacterium RBG_16_34_12]|uniref:Uncharacterized protein n=1 Tax=Candidatus Woesebacteria bacterium RBG_16_34_12 TaxID=1802480 RepID=A0A1F7X9R1_9BACT|nr:MAG: hypothetical protein A2Z22_00470 [Candidatus Woesebacteria bacterium RBG_16_34_12]
MQEDPFFGKKLNPQDRVSCLGRATEYYLERRYPEDDPLRYSEALTLINSDNVVVRAAVFEKITSYTGSWRVNVDGKSQYLWHDLDDDEKYGTLKSLTDVFRGKASDDSSPLVRARATGALAKFYRFATGPIIGVKKADYRSDLIKSSTSDFLELIRSEEDSYAKGSKILQAWRYVTNDCYPDRSMRESVNSLKNETNCFLNNPGYAEASVVLLFEILTSPYNGFEKLSGTDCFTFDKMFEIVQEDKSGKAGMEVVRLATKYVRQNLDRPTDTREIQILDSFIAAAAKLR